MIRFGQYTVIGTATFALDLCLLFLLVQYAGVPFYIATPCSFLIAVSGNYVLSRRFVFVGTQRGWNSGYVYFICIALAGAFVTTTLVVWLVATFHLFYLLARALTAVAVGVTNYFINLYWNFKVVGKH